MDRYGRAVLGCVEIVAEHRNGVLVSTVHVLLADVRLGGSHSGVPLHALRACPKKHPLAECQ